MQVSLEFKMKSASKYFSLFRNSVKAVSKDNTTKLLSHKQSFQQKPLHHRSDLNGTTFLSSGDSQ